MGVKAQVLEDFRSSLMAIKEVPATAAAAPSWCHVDWDSLTFDLEAEVVADTLGEGNSAGSGAGTVAFLPCSSSRPLVPGCR